MSSTESSTDILGARIDEAIATLQRLRGDEAIAASLSAAADASVRTLREGGRVILCGNGGSSADAQHLAAELVGKFMMDREPYSAIALSDNVAAVTAIGNDYSYDDVFVRGVRAHGRKGDVLIGMSTSGRSANVVKALQAGRDLGLVTVAFTGPDDSPMGDAADIVLRVDAPNTARIQEGQKLLGHTLFEMVELALCT